MHEQRNKQIVRRFVDEYQTNRDPQAFADLMDPGFVDHSRPPGIAEGAEGVRQQFDLFHAAFSGFRGEIDEQVAEGDLVVTRKRFHGVHDGEFLGLPPTGREVEIAVIDIVRLRDGRIAEHWNVVDRLGLLEQLGAVPAPAGASS